MLRFKNNTRHIVSILSIPFIVSACGGGGGGGSSDTLPDSFAPAASIDGVLLDEVATFDAFTVSGIDTDVDISISGAGEYSIDGGVTFISGSNTVSEGTEVIVQVVAADSFSTESSATLQIGDGTGVFVVESEAEDITPEAFELGDAVVVNEAEATGESELVTIAGINSNATISITDGEYRIGADGDYTTVEGTVTTGQMVQVRATGATTAPADTTATLTIGGVSDTFTVSTEDNTAPQADVIFPTPATLTDGTSVTLRGKASDNFGPIARIRVTVTTDDGATEVDSDVIEATATDDFANTWSLNVDLGTDTLNTIAIEAIDGSGNVQDEPTVITLLQNTDALNTNFPEGNDLRIGEISSRGMVLDKQNSRVLILNNITSPGDIFSIDLATGNRTIFLENNSDMDSAGPMHFSEETQQLYVVDINGSAIFQTFLDSPELTLLTDSTFPDTDVAYGGPFGLRFDEETGLLMVADRLNQVIAIDAIDGERSLISNNVENEIAPVFQTPLDLVINDSERSLLVTDSTFLDESATGTVLEISIDDGSRSNVNVQDGADFGRPYGIEWLVQDQVAVVSSRSTEGRDEPGRILQLDLEQNLLTVLAANDFPEGAGNNIQVPQFISVDQEQALIYVVSGAGDADSRSSILVLDANTGERVVLTRSVRQL